MATKEDKYLMTVWRVLSKPCTNLLQEVFRQHVSEEDMDTLLNDPAKTFEIVGFLHYVIHKELFYRRKGFFFERNFELPLFYILIRTLAGIPDHKTGWGNEPDVMDKSTAANIERIWMLRQKYSYRYTSHLTEKDFEKEWQKIISCIQEIENTLPGKTTTFGDAAKNYLVDLKKLGESGENMTKFKGTVCFL